jgi:hypothetical protein
VVDAWGPLFFTTHARLRGPDGQEVEWRSRRHRKRLGLVAVGGDERHVGRASRTSWTMGALFMVGSFCFAIGSLPLFFDRATPEAVAATFFVGSLFFTSAALVQYHEAAAAPVAMGTAKSRHGLRAIVGWHPHRIDWWATAIQLVGTFFFNVTTFAATLDDLSLSQEKHLIWAPDFWGSVCFLIASLLAYSEVAPRIWSRPDKSIGGRISALNLGGSIAFGAAALGARYLSTTGEPANISLVNLGTFVGAVCFFVGAALLPIESSRESTAATDR